MPPLNGSRLRRTRERGAIELLLGGLVVVFVATVLGPALLGRGSLSDVDLLTRVLPFRALGGPDLTSTIWCRGDIVDAYLPGIGALKQAMYSGSLPLWNPWEVGGAPFAALPDLAWLSPLSLPLWILPLSVATAYVKLAEVVVGIAGMSAFLRRLGASRPAAMLAGIIFVSSGFMTMWTMWPHTRVAAWIPALFWALERLVQERRARDVAILALIVASMLLGGFPAVTLYALTLAGAYVLARAWAVSRQRPRHALQAVGGAAGGVVLGVGVAAVQIAPFVANLGALGLEGRDYSASHLPTGMFLTAGVPDTVGLCVGGEVYGPVNPIEAVGYIGVAALVLIVVSLVLRVPRTAGSTTAPRLFLAIALAAIVGAIWVGGPFLRVLQELPFYGSNPISRGQSVFAFVGAALAGLGFDSLLRRARSRRTDTETAGQGRLRRRALAAAVLVAVALFSAWVVTSAFADARSGGYEAHLSEAVRIPLLLLVGSLLAVALALVGPGRARLVGVATIAVLAVAQSTWFVHTMLPLSDRENFYPTTPTHQFLRTHLEGDRYGAGDGTMYSATSAVYGLRTPVGHEFTAPRWRDLLNTADPGVFQSRTNSSFSPALSLDVAATSPLLDQLSVRYWVVAPENVAGDVDPAGLGDDRVVLRQGRREECAVGAGPLRGVALELQRIDPTRFTERPILHVAVHTDQGVRTGARLLRAPLEPGQVYVAVPGEDLRPGDDYRVEVWTSGVGGKVRFGGRDGQLGCAPVRPRDDGLRVASSTAGALVYERLAALPRIRWASRSEVVEDPARRLELLASGVADDVVLLDSADSPAAGGGPARVDVVTDDPEHIAVDVEAASGGYLVVADSLVRSGWSATVDGRAAPLVQGNHAFAAVHVPEGTHRVDLSYSAPGLRQGAIVSMMSLLLVGGLLVMPAVRRRLRSRRPAQHDAGPLA